MRRELSDARDARGAGTRSVSGASAQEKRAEEHGNIRAHRTMLSITSTHEESLNLLAVRGVRYGVQVVVHLREQLVDAAEALLIANEAQIPKGEFLAVNRFVEIP